MFVWRPTSKSFVHFYNGCHLIIFSRSFHYSSDDPRIRGTNLNQLSVNSDIYSLAVGLGQMPYQKGICFRNWTRIW
jgi:hypothetical protein